MPQGRAHQQPRVKDQRWPGTWMALGVFFALFTFFWVGPRTLVAAELLVKLLVVCGLAMLLLPYRITGLRLGMERSGATWCSTAP